MSKSKNPANDVVATIGASAEMAHSFYSSMIASGATAREATAGMQSFISAWWSTVLQISRPKREEFGNEE